MKIVKIRKEFASYLRDGIPTQLFFSKEAKVLGLKSYRLCSPILPKDKEAIKALFWEIMEYLKNTEFEHTLTFDKDIELNINCDEDIFCCKIVANLS